MWIICKPDKRQTVAQAGLEKADANALAAIETGQVAAGFLGFFGFALEDLTLAGFATGLRATGLISVGRPTDAEDAGSGRKCARQPGDSRALLRIMQAVTRSTSGISEPQN
jgi:hypothetical protein